MASSRGILSLLVAAMSVLSTPSSTCFLIADGQQHSLLSSLSSSSSQLFFRHAGYIGWITPDETTLDDQDTTFILHPGFVPGDGSAPTVSFENQCEFPGYFLLVDTNYRITLKDYDAANANISTFYARPGLNDPTACSFESVGYPGYYISSFGSTVSSSSSSMLKFTQDDARLNRAEDTPCHYADCPAVYAIPFPSSTSSSSFPVAASYPPAQYNLTSTWTVEPPNYGRPIPITPFSIGGLYVEVHNSTGTLGVVHDSSDTSGFSFTVADANRKTPGSHTLGDITMRVRFYNGDDAYTQATSVIQGNSKSAPIVTPYFPTSIWATDITSLLNTSSSVSNGWPSSLSVVREFTPSPDGVGLIMNFILTNTKRSVGGTSVDPSDPPPVDAAVEIGGFDVSMIFNQDWSGLSLEQNAATCSLVDPYIGKDASFVQVVRIIGSGPILMVTPSRYGCDATTTTNLSVVACGGGMEAWRILADDPAGRGVTFEGFYGYSIYSKAWQVNEWANASPWNEPTSLVLEEGQSAVLSLKLWTIPDTSSIGSANGNVDNIPIALEKAAREVNTTLGPTTVTTTNPFAQVFPGTVLTPDIQTAHILVLPPITGNSNMGPLPWTLGSITVDPADALVMGTPSSAPSANTGYITIPVSMPTFVTPPPTLGRTRVTLTFIPPPLPPQPLSAANESSLLFQSLPSPLITQTLQFFLLPSLSTHLDTYSAFTAEYSWYNDTTDPFARAYSYMDYDSSIAQVMTQEGRVYAVGLSDEAGAGSSLGFAITALHRPYANIFSATQIATYVNRTLINTKADGQGNHVSLQATDGSVKASMFYGGMPNYTYIVSPCWDQARSNTEWRSYNYPHPTMVLYSLYRITRENEEINSLSETIAADSNGSLDPLNTWEFYLQRAAQTVISMYSNCYDGNSYALCQFGLMVGSGFKLVLEALVEESAIDPTTWSSYANTVDGIQRNRTNIWIAVPFPYGSEMPFDSTGQEEIFTFTTYYQSSLGAPAWHTSNLTLNGVKAYTPLNPHWAYSGSARRYFDFAVNGKLVVGPTERSLQHYGSGINSIVLLDAYRLFPNESYALQAGFAGSWGTLTSIDVETGSPSMAFHGDASLLIHEPYAADWGVNQYGASSGWGCYIDTYSSAAKVLLDSEGVPAIGYGCDVVTVAGSDGSDGSGSSGMMKVLITPYDAASRRVYIGPLGMYITLRTSTFANLTLDTLTNPSQPTLTMWFDDYSTLTSSGGNGYFYDAIRVTIEVPAHADWVHAANISFATPSTAPPLVRGAYELPADTQHAVLTWVPV